MKLYASYSRITCTIIIIIISVFLLTTCINDKQEPTAVGVNVDSTFKTVGWSEFAGAEKCAGCHKAIYDTHLKTAHYLTLRPATAEYIKGSFDTGHNSLVFSERVKVVMEKRDSGFYQVAYFKGVENQRRRIDVVIGSGTKGQSYLNWMNNNLFQLPITYFTPANQWSNSPGYPGKVVFNRPITSRCLECHTTFAQKLSPEGKEPEDFDQNKILFGVDCEKCHGPGAKHVEFYTANPDDTTGRYIVQPAKLSRQQNLDLCSLCHGGRMSKKDASFTFQAGNKLSDHFAFDSIGRNATDIDVHGNQFGLLAASKCFKQSEMTCSSCHNSHANEREKLETFSNRCSSCHTTQHVGECKMKAVLGNTINSNCIDCHMPKQPSRSIAVLLQESSMPVAAMMRTHLVKIYPNETKKFRTSRK